MTAEIVRRAEESSEESSEEIPRAKDRNPWNYDDFGLLKKENAVKALKEKYPKITSKPRYQLPTNLLFHHILILVRAQEKDREVYHKMLNVTTIFC